RLQPVEQRLLAYPIVNSRDSQRAKLARLAGLRDLHLPHRLRPVDILLQFALQSIQLPIQLRGESFQTLPVHPSTTPVGLYCCNAPRYSPPSRQIILRLVSQLHSRLLSWDRIAACIGASEYPTGRLEPFPVALIVSERSSPSRVRCAAPQPGARP